MMMRTLAAGIFFLALSSASPAAAHYADYGPLDDIVAIRSAMAKQYRLPPAAVVRIIVVRDYAQAIVASKGSFIVWYRKRGGHWVESRRTNGVYIYDEASAARAESRGVPRDVVRTMLLVDR